MVYVFLVIGKTIRTVWAQLSRTPHDAHFIKGNWTWIDFGLSASPPPLPLPISISPPDAILVVYVPGIPGPNACHLADSYLWPEYSKGR